VDTILDKPRQLRETVHIGCLHLLQRLRQSSDRVLHAWQARMKLRDTDTFEIECMDALQAAQKAAASVLACLFPQRP
jgi:hypothetical protein